MKKETILANIKSFINIKDGILTKREDGRENS